jgi:hypothetical protein
LKLYSELPKGVWYCFLNAFLVFLMVFLLVPVGAPHASADTSNSIVKTSLTSDTISEDIIPSDNAMPDDSLIPPILYIAVSAIDVTANSAALLVARRQLLLPPQGLLLFPDSDG